MATYCMSDIHGYYSLFLKMLNYINFNKNDTLYILGDVVDRGVESYQMIKYIQEHDNIVLLLGNHEDMMFNALNSYDKYDEMFMNPQNNILWLFNGGNSTMDSIDDYRNKNNISEYEIYKDICDWVKTLPLYIKLNINSQDFFLSHSGINNSKSLSKQDNDDFIWTRYFYDENDLDYENLNFIFGHTPTYLIDKSTENNIMKFSKNNNVNLIDIDGGIYHDTFGKLNCIRLEDMQCFSLNNKEIVVKYFLK